MIDFLLKSGNAMLVLLAVYHLFLEKEKMHRFNRFYLLGALVFSLALPLITIPVYVEASQEIPAPQITQLQGGILPEDFAAHAAPQEIQNPEATVVLKKQVTVTKPNYWPYLGFGLYLLITLGLAVRFCLNILRFYRVKMQNETITYKEATLILLDDKVLPHTFFGNIYVNKTDYKNRLIEPELFTHELVHVNQKHTLDILFAEALKTLFWFNPLVYFYKRAIQLNHEFLADDTTINEHRNVPVYQQLLLEKATPIVAYPLASSINFSITKKRFIMMTKTTNKTKSTLLKFTVLPVTVGLLYFLSTETIMYAKGTAATPAMDGGLKIANRVAEVAPAPEVPMEEAIEEQLGKDTIAGDARRDEYYKGVKVVINDKPKGIAVSKPYEQLTAEQKEYYLPAPPQKRGEGSKGLSDADYEFYKKYEDGTYYIDDKKVTREEVFSRKREDFASSGFKFSGITGNDNKFVEIHRFFFYTHSFYNKNIRHLNDHYPDKVLKITVEDKAENVLPPEIAEYGNNYLEKSREKEEKELAAQSYDNVGEMKENAKVINAKFPGGSVKFDQYLAENIDAAKLEGKTITVVFDINTDGSLSVAKMANGTDPELEAEVKRVIENSPRWIPSQKNGKPYKTGSMITLPENPSK